MLFGYSFRDSSFWIFLQTSLTLLHGAVLNQAIQLFLPLSKVSKNLELISGYLAVGFLFSTVITLVSRQLFRTHTKVKHWQHLAKNWLYQFMVRFYRLFLPLLYLLFKDKYLDKIIFLSFHSCLSLYCRFPRCILPYIFLNNSTLFIKIN